MRLTVRRVVEAVALYPERADLFREYPALDEEDVRQALEFAAANLEGGHRIPAAMRLVMEEASRLLRVAPAGQR